jgi:hypothetical protein
MTKSQVYKNEPIEVKETEESALIVAALGVFRPGTQSSADFFNQKLPLRHPARVSRQTVWNWANGVYKPSERVLMAWRIFYGHDDPRYALAVKLSQGREREAAHWVGVENAVRVVPTGGCALEHGEVRA